MKIAEIKDFSDKVSNRGYVLNGELSTVEDFEEIIQRVFPEKLDVLFFVTRSMSEKIRTMLKGFYEEPLNQTRFLINYSIYISGVKFNCVENYELEKSVMIDPECKPEKSVLILESSR